MLLRWKSIRLMHNKIIAKAQQLHCLMQLGMLKLCSVVLLSSTRLAYSNLFCHILFCQEYIIAERILLCVLLCKCIVDN